MSGGHEQGNAMTMVAACTVAAAHRRDHAHQQGDGCHPHRVEVIRLGRQAVVVCHDCCADTGYLVARSAETLAAAHRRQTVRDHAPLASPPAA
jgi:hypothetical protein